MDWRLPSREASHRQGWTHQVQWEEDGRVGFLRCTSLDEANARATKLSARGQSPEIIDLTTLPWSPSPQTQRLPLLRRLRIRWLRRAQGILLRRMGVAERGVALCQRVGIVQWGGLQLFDEEWAARADQWKTKRARHKREFLRLHDRINYLQRLEGVA